MENTFITITGLSHYIGTRPFKVGRVVKLVKELDNDYDTEAVRVDMPYLDTVGYVANSVHTVYEGTSSAGRIYDRIGDVAFAQVMFITHSSVIAQILSKEELVSALTSEKDFFDMPECNTCPEDKEDVIRF